MVAAGELDEQGGVGCERAKKRDNLALLGDPTTALPLNLLDASPTSRETNEPERLGCAEAIYLTRCSRL